MDFQSAKLWVIFAVIGLILSGISFVFIGFPNAPNIFTVSVVCLLVAALFYFRD